MLDKRKRLRAYRLLRLSLVAKFSITSFFLMAGIGLLLGVDLTQRLEEQAIEQQKLVVSALVPPIVGPYLSSDLLANGARGQNYQNIDAALSYLGGLGLVEVRIVNSQGTVVYADKSNLVGEKAPPNTGLTEASAGSPYAQLLSKNSPNSLEDQGYGRLLAVYTPIQLPGTAKIGAVFEGYYDADDLLERIDYINNFLWLGIGFGFVFLYTALFAIVYNASRTLTEQSQENARLYGQSERRLMERISAEKQTQRQVARLAALRAIDIAITSSMDLQLTVDVILEQVCEQLGVDSADILILNNYTMEMVYAGGRGFRSSAVSGSLVRPGQGYAGQAIFERRSSGVVGFGQALDARRAGLLASEQFVSYAVVPLIAKGQVKGVLEVFHRSPLDVDAEWSGFLEALAGQTAIAVDSAALFTDLQRSNLNLALAYDMTLEGWSHALDLRDKETEGHTRRVTEMTLQLGRFMGVEESELVHMRRGALLHDIGKMGIPDAILLKPGPLSPEEWVIMKRHPTYAFQMLSPIPFLKGALDIPHYHHEKWDGTGYPDGLQGQQIPFAARIFAVVDVWDALSSDRPYRKAMAEEQVRSYIIEQSGKHFDPAVVEAFLRLKWPEQYGRSARISSDIPVEENREPSLASS